MPKEAPAPQRFEYVEREPVMTGLQKMTDINYVRAQIATDEELKQIVKEYRNPGSVTFATTRDAGHDDASKELGLSVDLQTADDEDAVLADMHASSTSATSSTAARKPRHTSSTGESTAAKPPRTPKSKSVPKPRPFRKMTTPKHLQPQGVHLKEVPAWHEHRLGAFEKGKKYAWGLGGGPGNGGVAAKSWTVGRGRGV